MKFRNLKKASNFEIADYFRDKLNITKDNYHYFKMVDYIEKAPFYFYKKKEYQPNILWRLSILLFPLVYLVVIIGLPINFIITGRWGYGRMNWFLKWLDNLKM